MKRMHEIETKEGAVVIDGNPLPSPVKLYRHYIRVADADSGENLYFSIICSRESKFNSWNEVVEFANANYRMLIGSTFSDDGTLLGSITDVQDHYIKFVYYSYNSSESTYVPTTFEIWDDEGDLPGALQFDLVAEL